MSTEAIRARLWQLQDETYRDFQARLLPTVAKEAIIGVRTPQLRALARELARADGAAAFLAELPHRYFEENQLQAFLIAEDRDFSRCLAAVERFLPYIDNWATCDQLSPKVFRKYPAELLPHLETFLTAAAPYTVRFAIGMLMQHYLDEHFDLRYPQLVAAVRFPEYYVSMMVAWYFATALAKQYHAALPFIEENRLDAWTHNKAIRKALESYRITPEQKDYLRTLKRRGAAAPRPPIGMP